ncbi:MAG: tRNA preQ1(34) S-adenosylmethionine ribosyltransferase-isomerase QueA [Planctomycetota bacterium]
MYQKRGNAEFGHLAATRRRTLIKTDRFDYHLPPDRIASHPVPDRSASRMLHWIRSNASLNHRRFNDIVDCLRDSDLIVRNNTRVLYARFRGTRDSTGGAVEVLFQHPCDPDGHPYVVDPYRFDDDRVRRWLVLTKSGGKLRTGESLSLGEGLKAIINKRLGLDGDIVSIEGDARLLAAELAIESQEQAHQRTAEIPLPPYIRRDACQPDADDSRAYQTVYASEPGAIAAPTAGLHFTPQILDELNTRGVGVVDVTLHVGAGTFRPVKTDDAESHSMHLEWFNIEVETANRINAAKANGRRIVAIGTTSLRALESAADMDGIVHPGARWTDLFMYPPAQFRIVDALLTNFHLPRSSLMMLVAAFLAPGTEDGIETIQSLYSTAIRENYRFFSYGDCMLIE